MRGLRIATLLVAVGMLLLPPRWCCAMPGSPLACCAACTPKAEAPAKSCCACETSEPCCQGLPKPAPAECVCHFGQMRKEPSVLADLVAPTTDLTTTIVAVTIAPAPISFVDDLLPPYDVQSRLCRWQI